jgi:hypothetical protein
MASAPPPTKPSSPPTATPKKAFGEVNTKIGNAIVLAAVPGWGKTTCAAYAKKPQIIMCGNEQGYRTLLRNSLVPHIPGVVVATWEELLEVVDSLVASDDEHETLVIDSIGAVEAMCVEYMVRKQFGGDRDKYDAYGKGNDRLPGEFIKLLARFDTIKEKHGKDVLILGHVKIKNFKNPEGADYDRYIVDVHEKVWTCIDRWADAVLFGKYQMLIKTSKENPTKGKAIGGEDRIVQTRHDDRWDAKNRYNMPESIDIPNDPTQIYSTIFAYVHGE